MGMLSMLMFVVACAPGNGGSTQLAFIRDGALWTIQPDGSNRFAVTGSTALGFAWSPDHHAFVVRFAASKTLPARDPLAGSYPDTPARFGVVSIDGGNILQITPDDAPVRSDAFWDAHGNRLVYRERYGSSTFWLQSQSDQPAGIARKDLGDFPTIPATAPDGASDIIIDAAGHLLTGPPQGPYTTLASDVLTALPGQDRPVRVLWQPQHDAFLYPVPASTPGMVTLRLRTTTGQTSDILTSSSLERWAFAPDGGRLLWRDAQGYAILSLATGHIVRWSDAEGLLWWSPDGAHLLLMTSDHLALITAATGTSTTLARWTALDTSATAAGMAFPVTGSPWNPAGTAFAFRAPGGQWVAGKTPVALPTARGAGDGIYVAAVPSLAPPRLVDWGNHGTWSWSTPDPNTTWLWP